MSLTDRTLLHPLGWCEFFEAQWETLNRNDWVPARIVGEERDCFRIQTGRGVFWAEISGHFRFAVSQRCELPAIGDWVACGLQLGNERATIHHRFHRRSCLKRKMVGGTHQEQILAANVDIALITTSANGDLNLRRLERYLALVWDSGAVPLVLLTKADLATDLEAAIIEISGIAPGVEIHAVSGVTGFGMDELSRSLHAGKTIVLLGSSGVGKSTLVNFLMGREAAKTQTIREKDDRGRHTTTSRHLFELPGLGMLIDTPGMRELGLLDHEEGLKTLFDDIEALSLRCRFSDCQHRTEPGCQIKIALANGDLTPERMESFRKLQREILFEKRKSDKAFASESRKEWKRASKALRIRRY